MNWAKYAPFFTEEEFKCKHTGLCEMNEQFMEKVLALRKAYNKPIRISSGYRDKKHPIEAVKTTSGAHTTGNACDIAVSHAEAFEILSIAMSLGFTGIGVQQKGAGRFIHLDDLPNSKVFTRPTVWSY